MIRSFASCFSSAAVQSIAVVAAILPTAFTPVVQAQSFTARDSGLALHALNRLTFGPRPGDVSRVLAVGTDRWIAEQLNADTVVDATARAALRRCELFTQPVDSAVGRLNARESFQMIRADGSMSSASVLGGGTYVVTRDSARKIRNTPMLGFFLANGQLHACRLARLENADSQLLEVMTDFWTNHFSISGQKLKVRGHLVHYDRAVIRAHALGKFRELLGAVAKSPAMLSYLDNDVNSADSMRKSLTPYRPPTIPRGNSNAVLLRPGLNENYARELLELHTMGVDAGYTQLDVINVARAMTGWSHTAAVAGGDELTAALMMLRLGPLSTTPVSIPFMFDSSRHDAEEKQLLGHTLRAGRGMEDGEDVLDILAKHPATARFIAKKLATRFVSDDPPASVIEKAAAAFTRSDGDIREVVRTIVMSDEFRSPSVFGAKVKSPQEFVLSLRRVLNAPPDTAAEIVDLLIKLDQPPFGRMSPEGWPETASPWINVGAMSARIEIAVNAARNTLPSIPIDNWPAWRSLSTQPFDAQVSGVVNAILHGRVTPETRRALELLRPAATDDATGRERTLRELLAMALSSVDFQRR